MRMRGCTVAVAGLLLLLSLASGAPFGDDITKLHDPLFSLLVLELKEEVPLRQKRSELASTSAAPITPNGLHRLTWGGK